MKVPPVLYMSARVHSLLQAFVEREYPYEACGLLLGPLSVPRRATAFADMKNILRDEGRGRFDFMFSPQEFMASQVSAEKMQLDIVGIFHSHPDHPPRPSPTDASQPMLAGWINVIASVHGGKFKEARAWWREDENHPFEESELVVEALT